MHRETKITLTILAIVVLVMGGYALYTSQRAGPPTESLDEVGQTVATGNYQTLDGDTYAFAPEAHALTVVVSWASWCPACENELRQALALSESYASSGVAVVAMNRAESPARTQQYIQAVVPELLQSEVVVVTDPTDHLFASIGGYTAPETIILTPDGTVQHHVHGVMDDVSIRAAIEAAL